MYLEVVLDASSQMQFLLQYFGLFTPGANAVVMEEKLISHGPVTYGATLRRRNCRVENNKPPCITGGEG